MLCAMADPVTIEDLCSELDLVAWDLQLTCIFCKCFLDYQDLCAFMYKDLRLKWQKGFPFGACQRCVLLQARVLAWRYQMRAAYAVTVEQDCRLPLSDIKIRCIVCAIPLRTEDKVRHVEENRRFIQTSGYWRGRCHYCWYTQL
ncbi:early protein E6 [Saimiri sciureus papillomavirus 2]|uniref:Protein E6 n=1 Tax=Saimiri sciureus papillomavirus 2 TaxID=990305 RepID=W5QK81_9PAPI|nr:early protein E6 [Saimiri sciureus papillomavirus 2]